MSCTISTVSRLGGRRHTVRCTTTTSTLLACFNLTYLPTCNWTDSRFLGECCLEAPPQNLCPGLWCVNAMHALVTEKHSLSFVALRKSIQSKYVSPPRAHCITGYCNTGIQMNLKKIRFFRAIWFLLRVFDHYISRLQFLKIKTSKFNILRLWILRHSRKAAEFQGNRMRFIQKLLIRVPPHIWHARWSLYFGGERSMTQLGRQQFEKKPQIISRAFIPRGNI